jgi:hypothetical protein
MTTKCYNISSLQAATPWSALPIIVTRGVFFIMVNINTTEMLRANDSPLEPEGTPRLPDDPEIQQEALTDYLVYWGARHDIDAITRIACTEAVLALGRFKRTILTGRRGAPFGRSMMALQTFASNFGGSAARGAMEGRGVAISFSNYFNADAQVEKYQADAQTMASGLQMLDAARRSGAG